VRLESVDKGLEWDLGLGVAKQGDRDEGVIGSDRLVRTDALIGLGTSVAAVKARQWSECLSNTARRRSQVHGNGHPVRPVPDLEGEGRSITDESVDSSLGHVEQREELCRSQIPSQHDA